MSAELDSFLKSSSGATETFRWLNAWAILPVYSAQNKKR